MKNSVIKSIIKNTFLSNHYNIENYFDENNLVYTGECVIDGGFTLNYNCSDSKELFEQNLKTQPDDWYYRTHEVKYKLEAGKAIIYPTGVRHRVDKVTSGERHVCVFWIESALQDTRMREIYRGIDMMINKYLCEPDAADLISKKGFELQHHIMRHFAQYI